MQNGSRGVFSSMVDGRAGRMRLGLAVVGALALSALLPVSAAQAEGPNAVRSLAGCTTNTLLANDDGSTGLVPIGFTANFHGESFTSCTSTTTATSPSTTRSASTRRTTSRPAGEPDHRPVPRGRRHQGRRAPGARDDLRNGRRRWAAWMRSASTGSTSATSASHVDKLNSFQLLLDRPAARGTSTSMFNYDKVNWETGDASGGSNGFGGSPAAVGFANGDGDPSHLLRPRRLVRAAELLAERRPQGADQRDARNSGGQLGRYVFNVVNAPPDWRHPDRGGPGAGVQRPR